MTGLPKAPVNRSAPTATVVPVVIYEDALSSSSRSARARWAAGPVLDPEDGPGSGQEVGSKSRSATWGPHPAAHVLFTPRDARSAGGGHLGTGGPRRSRDDTRIPESPRIDPGRGELTETLHQLHQTGRKVLSLFEVTCVSSGSTTPRNGESHYRPSIKMKSPEEADWRMRTSS